MFEPNLTINSFFPTNLCKKGLHPRGRAGWHCLSFPFYRGERRGGATRWERGRGEPSRPGWGVAAPAVVSALCTSAPAWAVSPLSGPRGCREGDGSHPARVRRSRESAAQASGPRAPRSTQRAHRSSFVVSLSFQENVSSSFEVLQLLIKCILVVIWRIGLFTRVTAGL